MLSLIFMSWSIIVGVTECSACRPCSAFHLEMGQKGIFFSLLLFQHNCFCFQFIEQKLCVSYFIPLHSTEPLWSLCMLPLSRSVDTVTDAPPCRAMCQQLYPRQLHLEHRCHGCVKKKWQTENNGYILEWHCFIFPDDFESRRADCFNLFLNLGLRVLITFFDLSVAASDVPDYYIIFRSTTEDETITHCPKHHGRHIAMVTSKFQGRLHETFKFFLCLILNIFDK